MKKHKLGFTLVELIVVITILAILGTLGFLSFQKYSMHSRDSVRLTDIKIIEKSLGLHLALTGKYPLPDNYFTITSQGVVIGYQGVIGEDTSREIQLNNIPVDPSLHENYPYSLGKDNKTYGIFSLFESGF